jgi:hypothetical protein
MMYIINLNSLVGTIFTFQQHFEIVLVYSEVICGGGNKVSAVFSIPESIVRQSMCVMLSVLLINLSVKGHIYVAIGCSSFSSLHITESF